MAKQIINIGTEELSGDGESLRSAFDKINQNFTETYDKWGAIEVNGSTISTDDSSEITIAQNLRVTSDLSMEGHIVPATNLTYDLGTPDKQFRSLYVSNDTIFMGGVPLRVNGTNNTIIVGTGEIGNVIATEDYVANTLASGIDVENDWLIQVNGFTWRFDEGGVLTLPAGSDIVDNQGNSVLGGGGAGPIQPYLELTNDPFITQPAVLGTPVTVTAAPWGNNALFQVDILEGSVLGTVTISQPGTGYVSGQNYIIFNYQIGYGGDNINGNLTFTIDTVNGSGGILTITNIVFTGTPSNSTGSYGGVSITYQPSVFDEIDTGLVLTRGSNQGIFNIEAETDYDNSTYLSPLGTEWNADGWGDLTGLNRRTYTTWRQALNNQVGNYILGAELVMHDTINDKYYKFDFTNWGGNNGGFSYTRTEVTDPNYFKKDDYTTANNVDVIEDDSTLQIGITRGENNGIYNPFTEEGWNENVSPQGTQWNIDGWDDLTNVETRTYTNLYAAFGNGGLGNKIVGTECVMYVPSIEKYYAIKFLSWTQGNAGGGFSYTRKEIDLTQLNQGIKFADGSVLKSADDFNRIKSTASGERRIEEVSGSKLVAVTPVVTTNLTALTSRSGSNTNQIWIDSTTTTIDDIISNPGSYGITDSQTIQFSFDNSNWYPFTGGTGFDGNERGFSIPLNVTYGQGDSFYFRYKTGGAPQVWWDKNDLPNGGNNFRGAVIDYHAYSGEATWIGTIHIVDDSGEEHISHTEVASGSTDAENDDLWLVQNEGTISYRRIDGEPKTLKVHWTARVFYGSEFWD